MRYLSFLLHLQLKMIVVAIALDTPMQAIRVCCWIIGGSSPPLVRNSQPPHVIMSAAINFVVHVAYVWHSHQVMSNEGKERNENPWAVALTRSLASNI